MGISQRQIVQECFEEERERDCSYCPAHHSKGGECCFGHRYEDHDSQCLKCLHESACGPATYSFERRTERPHRPVRRSLSPGSSRLPIYGHGKDNGNLLTEEPKTSIQRKNQDHEVKVAHHVPQSKKSKTKSFFKKMGLNAIWGAGEGSLEMVLGFMRRRRPE